MSAFPMIEIKYPGWVPTRVEAKKFYEDDPDFRRAQDLQRSDRLRGATVETAYGDVVRISTLVGNMLITDRGYMHADKVKWSTLETKSLKYNALAQRILNALERERGPVHVEELSIHAGFRPGSGDDGTHLVQEDLDRLVRDGHVRELRGGLCESVRSAFKLVPGHRELLAYLMRKRSVPIEQIARDFDLGALETDELRAMLKRMVRSGYVEEFSGMTFGAKAASVDTSPVEQAVALVMVKMGLDRVLATWGSSPANKTVDRQWHGKAGYGSGGIFNWTAREVERFVGEQVQDEDGETYTIADEGDGYIVITDKRRRRIVSGRNLQGIARTLNDLGARPI